MAISHADHDHPNTPAARAACRKRLANGQSPRDEATERALNHPVRKLAEEAGLTNKPGVWHVKPKGKVPTAAKNVKRENTRIKNRSDLADVPHALVHGIEEAWARDLDVLVGDKFRDDEARIVIKGEVCQISLVWKVGNPHGVWAIWVRNWDSSKGYKVSSVAEAFTVSEDRDLWDDYGNLRTA